MSICSEHQEPVKGCRLCATEFKPPQAFIYSRRCSLCRDLGVYEDTGRCPECETAFRADRLALLREINAAAEADMLKGNPITGAHHRAIERKIRELESAG